jgi:hypothetical protein
MSCFRLRPALVIVLAIVTTACAGEAPVPDPPSFESVSTTGATEMPPGEPFAEGRPGETGGTILRPVSAPIAQATAYRFSLGHCGLSSPIDVDGSFWDPIDGLTAAGGPLDLESDGEMINATAGFFVVIGDEARFRTESGSVLSLERHEGEKEFPGCD